MLSTSQRLARVCLRKKCASVVRPSSRRYSSVASKIPHGHQPHIPEFKWWGWGSTDHGQFGTGEQYMVQPSPFELKQINDLKLDQVSVGMNLCVGRNSLDRNVYCWGENHGGAIITSIAGDILSPTPFAVADAAYAGWCNAWLIGDERGKVTRWGQPGGFYEFSGMHANEFKEMASSAYQSVFIQHDGTPIIVNDREDVEYQTGPMPSSIKHVARGWSHFLLLDTHGSVWVVGANLHGQCGLGHTNHVSSITKNYLLSSQKIRMIASGATHSMALTESGKVLIWGSFKDGKLGIDTTKDMLQPTEMTFFNDKHITIIAAGCDHSVAVSKNGEIYTWGFGQHGALGSGNLLDTPLPQKCERFTDDHIVEVQCGMDVTFVKTKHKL